MSESESKIQCAETLPPSDSEESKMSDVDEPSSSQLIRYREAVSGVRNMEAISEQANPAAYGISLIGIPVMAVGFDWVSVWSAVGLGIAGLIVLGAGTSMIKAVSRWFKTSLLGVQIANCVPMLGLGATLGIVFQPHWVGFGFGAGLMVSFLLALRTLWTERQTTLTALQLSQDLQHELTTFTPDSLHDRVSRCLETAFESRGHLLETLRNTLDDDPLIDVSSTLTEVDGALVEMLDRAVPLSVLLTRSNENNQVLQADAERAYVVFSSLREKVDDVLNVTLGYAGTRDASVLETLHARVSDLANTRAVNQELERF